jgi:hypothetical protein
VYLRKLSSVGVEAGTGAGIGAERNNFWSTTLPSTGVPFCVAAQFSGLILFDANIVSSVYLFHVRPTGISVADPGCLSRIQIFPSRIQGQKDCRICIRIKEFQP